jgi:uncharacterized membrane protein
VESNHRSIAKTLSWRFVATIITTLVTLVATGELKFALTIGLADTTIKMGAYFLHERVWNRVNFGRAVKPEYQI